MRPASSALARVSSCVCLRRMLLTTPAGVGGPCCPLLSQPVDGPRGEVRERLGKLKDDENGNHEFMEESLSLPPTGNSAVRGVAASSEAFSASESPSAFSLSLFSDVGLRLFASLE